MTEWLKKEKNLMTNRDQENELLTLQTYAKTYSHIISAKIFSKILFYFDSGRCPIEMIILLFSWWFFYFSFKYQIAIRISFASQPYSNERNASTLDRLTMKETKAKLLCCCSVSLISSVSCELSSSTMVYKA